MTPFPLRCLEAEAKHGPALAAFFERNSRGCYCQYWHFEGTSPEWLDRCFHRPEDNRAACVEASRTRSDLSHLVIALSDDERVVGSLKSAPAFALPKLYNQRLYRGLRCFEGDRRGVWTLGCCLVDESVRRQGVLRALVELWIDCAARWGAEMLEAVPRRGESLHPAEMWLGPYDLLREFGFEVVHDFLPYPVLRRRLLSP